MEFHGRKHIFYQNLLKCFLWLYWILDASLFVLIVSLELQIHIQIAQSTGTSGAGVLTYVSRFSLLPVIAIVNPRVEPGAVAVQCEISSRVSKPAGSLPFTSLPEVELGLRVGGGGPLSSLLHFPSASGPNSAD